VGLTSGVTAVAAGSSYSCAITSGGGVKCWGSNSNGSLGDGSTTLDSLTPVDVVGLASGVTAIAAGQGNTCALTSRGGVKCWGNNASGQLGNGSTTNSLVPVDVAGLTSGVSAISVGDIHACALTSEGGVKCWGDNTYGRLGTVSTSNSLVPVDVAGLTSGATAIAAGSVNTCAVTTSGGVKCWGGGGVGALGDGNFEGSYTPVRVVGLSIKIRALATGGGNTCALTTKGGVKCWGSNSFGQLGNATKSFGLTPADVTGLAKGVKAISVGLYYACAAMNTGAVKCWGNNSFGQLGNGSTSSSATPVDVTFDGTGL
jgi:alpha-tubulin suppressor-like RCC1 family protein